MRKLMKRKVNLFGKEISVFVISLFAIALVSAALISYWGVITGSVIVGQGLFLDDKPWDDKTITYEESLTSLETKTVSSGEHYLENTANVDAEFSLVTTCKYGTEDTLCGDNPIEDAIPTVEYLLDAEYINYVAGDGYTNANFTAGREVVTIILPANTMTLGDIEKIDFEQYVTKGYPVSVNILLDVDEDGVFNSLKDLETGYLTEGEDSVLKLEWASNNPSGTVTQPSNDDATPYTVVGDYDNWIGVFNGQDSITSTANAWLYENAPGPGVLGCEFNIHTLADWSATDGTMSRGTACCEVSDIWHQKLCDDITINSDTKVYGIQIETLGWIAQSSSKVRNIKVNNVAYEMSGLPAGEQTDFEVLTNFPKMMFPDTYTIETKVLA